MKPFLVSILLLLSCSVAAQKKMLDHADFDIWNTIENEVLSPDGAHVMYSLERGEADQFLKIHSSDGTPVFNYDRGQDGQFSHDSQFALFTIKAWKDSVMEMKRRKVKKDELPKDSLGIYRVSDQSLVKIGGVRSYKVPEKWGGFIAYQLEAEKAKK